MSSQHFDNNLNNYLKLLILFSVTEGLELTEGYTSTPLRLMDNLE